MFGCQHNHSGGCILNMLKPLNSFFSAVHTKVKYRSPVWRLWKRAKVFLLYGDWYISLYCWYFEGGRSLPCIQLWHDVPLTWLYLYRTPIFLAVDGGGGRWLAFKTTSSVLSLFILRMFTIIHASISRTQSSITNLARSAVDDMKVRCNCVSSAYKWKLALWCLLISLKGHI